MWQSPAPGAQVIATQKTVTITASDAMGNTSSVSFQVRIAPSPAVARVTTGGAVPNAGVGDAPRIPAGAVWSGFGSPVISEGGYFAFLGKWKSPSGKGVGIFSSNDTEGTPRLEVKVGDSVNGVAGAVWKTLGDPVYFYPSGVAWIGTISGPGITFVNDTAVGSAAVSFSTVLREGESPQPLGGARINGVRNIAAVGPFGTLLLDVTLEVGTGTPATTSATDRAALMWLPESGVILLFREGQNIGEGSETLKNYLFLDSIPGSPGHGRATRSFGTTALWTLSSGRKSAMQDGNIFAETGGDVDNYSPGARWAKVGIPSRNDLGDVSAMRGTLKVGPGGVTAANASGIFFNDDTYWYNVARMNGPSPGIAGATFATFLDPVVGGHFVNRHGAVIAKVRGSSVTSADNTGIWHGGRADWTLLAREGAQPPSAPAGAKWKAFTSLAMPQDAGPIFTATLQRGPGGITSADDTALYGLGSDDILYELLREGQTLLGGKVVQSFNVLTATLGSQGTTRHFNSAGGIVARVEFTDHTSAIVRLSVP